MDGAGCRVWDVVAARDARAAYVVALVWRRMRAGREAVGVRSMGGWHVWLEAACHDVGMAFWNVRDGGSGM